MPQSRVEAIASFAGACARAVERAECLQVCKAKQAFYRRILVTEHDAVIDAQYRFAIRVLDDVVAELKAREP